MRPIRRLQAFEKAGADVLFAPGLPDLHRRISLATSLYRAAMTALLEAGRQVKDRGEFDFLDRCAVTPEL